MSRLSSVAQLRRFNRSFTQRIGVLDESFLSTGLPLATARLLFEIGLDQANGGVTVRELRSRVGLDSGYVSRLLRQLEARELLIVTGDDVDGRRRHVRLSSAGEHEWQQLDQRSDDLATSLVGPLSDSERDELSRALATAERLLHRATVTMSVVDANSRTARSVMEAYFAELDRRFDGGFDADGAFDDDTGIFDPPDGCFVVVFDGDRAAGCGGLQPLDPETAEIKRMWLHPSLRSLGLGRDLLGRLEIEAAAIGYSTVVLDTNAELTPAISLYETSGYTPIERYNDNPYAQRWFRKTLE